jgi:hypothetical protein
VLLGRGIKTWMLVAALLILAVEAVFLYRHYDLYYYASDAAPGTAPRSAQTLEGKMPEGAILEEPTAAPAGAPVEVTDAAEAPDPDERAGNGGVSFVHRATDENSRGDYTYLDHPSINGDPDAVVLVVPDPDRGNAGGGAYDHNIGVWYEPGERKWAVFNQDLAAVPAGSAFEVVVPPAEEGFVHRAAPPNTVGNATYLDNPLVNGEPDAEVSVTQNWNPGGGNGVYNDHPVGVRYEEDEKRWAVYNRDEAQIRDRAAFNVTVLKGDDKAR